jgi:uncharacterized membrane protein
MAYLHHVLLHFPVALSVTAALFVVLSWFRPSGSWAETARWVLYLAALAAVATAITGLVAASHVVDLGGDADAVRRHRSVALPAAIALVVAAVVTWATKGAKERPGAKVAGALTLGAAVAVGAGAHFGGDMLHPGLAPWSNEAHHHGPTPSGSASASADHHGSDGSPHGDAAPGASGSAMHSSSGGDGAHEAHDPSPSASGPAAPPPSGSVVPPPAPNPSMGPPPSRPVPPGKLPSAAPSPAAAPSTPDGHGSHQHHGGGR